MSDAQPQLSLRGLHVLAVEDEALVAMLLEDLLVDLGCHVVGPAATVARALRLLDDEVVHAAVLDINISGTTAFPIADALRARRIPFIFASGYGIAGLVEEYRGHTVLQKPYSSALLETALLRVARQPG